MEKLKQNYQQFRQQIIQAIPQRPGLQVVNMYARAMDKLLNAVFQNTFKTRDFSPQIATQLALLAQGGYGRRELNLYSDIDLVFLCAEQVDAQIEEFIKAVLYFLWDLNLEVGYFVRTVSETGQLLGKDMASTTAMIEARIIAGNKALFDVVQE
ncbi:MAG: bifunctional uridylyltransferase/uridylyl-removing protein, partial [Candidatus Sumerlaeia bacterium]|nr:bifunctional uridylyltransferase/uridylyl-removing protein [Candidatus Sumerlaeia bacterium]